MPRVFRTLAHGDVGVLHHRPKPAEERSEPYAQPDRLRTRLDRPCPGFLFRISRHSLTTPGTHCTHTRGEHHPKVKYSSTTIGVKLCFSPRRTLLASFAANPQARYARRRNMELNRRNFLKLSAACAGVAALSATGCSPKTLEEKNEDSDRRRPGASLQPGSALPEGPGVRRRRLLARPPEIPHDAGRRARRGRMEARQLG